MTFGGSRMLDDHFTSVDRAIFIVPVQECFDAVGVPLDGDVLETVIRPPLVIRMRDWQRLRQRLGMLEGADQNAEYLRRIILIQHAINQICSAEGIHPFDTSGPFPGGANRLSDNAADALLSYGRGQFTVLQRACDEIVSWVRSRGIKGLAIVESPLGNVIPVRLLGRKLDRAGIPWKRVDVSLPRNEKRGATERVTLRDRVHEFVEQLNEGDQLLYMDDAITGTRFGKTLKEIRRSAKQRGLAAPLAIAYACERRGGLTLVQQERRDSVRRDMEEQTRSTDLTSWWELPSLPVIDCGAKGKYSWQSPLAWGESDLIAGLRKVNLMFNLIEEFRWTTEQICAGNQEILKRLELLWRADRNGEEFVFEKGVLQGALCAASGKVDWKRIHDEAIKRFRDDYDGVIPDLIADSGVSSVELRLTWLRDQVLRHAGKDDPQEGWLLWNAVDNLFVSAEGRNGDPRDRDFCYYFIEYHPAVVRIREQVVARLEG